MFLLLLKSRLQIWKNQLFRAGRRQQLSRLMWYGLGIYMFISIVTGSVGLFTTLGGMAPTYVPSVLTALFSTLITFTLFWGMGGLLGQLYLNSDMELLLAAPIRRRDIFLLTVVESTRSVFLPAALALAVLIGFGIAGGATALYYVWMALAIIAMLILLVTLSMLLIMLVMRVVPVKRARELLTFIWVIFFGGLWFGWMLLSRRGNMFDSLLQSQDTLVQVGSAVGWSPAGWAAHSLVELLSGQWTAFAGHAGLLLVGAALSVALAYYVYDRTFYRSWGMMHEIPTRKTRRVSTRARSETLLQRVARAMPWPAGEIALKDWTIIPRDLRWMTGLVMPLIVGVFYVYTFGFSDDSVSQVFGANYWLTLLLCPLIVFLFAASICLPAIGSEGKHMGLLRAAPLSVGGFMWGKVVSTGVVLTLFSLIIGMLVAMVLGVTGAALGLVIMQVFWFSVLFAMAGVAAGGIAPDFSADQPRRAAGVAGSYGLMLMAALFIVAHLALGATLSIQLAPTGAHSLALAQVLDGGMAGFLASGWGLLASAGVYALAMVVLFVVWRYSRRKLEAWQPTDA